MRAFWKYCVALLIALALLPQAAKAAEPALEPLEKWVLNYGDDSCRLARAFGEGDAKVLLLLDQFQPEGVLDMSLVGKRFKWLGRTRVSLSSTFGPGLPNGTFRDAITGTIGPDNTAILMSGPRDLLNRPFGHKATDDEDAYLPITSEQAAAITELSIAASGMRRLTLHTGSMGAPLGAMKKCIAEFVKAWGLDPVQQAVLSKRVVPASKPGMWLLPDDFPKGPLFQGASAIVQFRLMVGADGIPTECHIQQATKSPEFTKLTCDLLVKRARFTPALDSGGKPVASYYISSVRWLAAE
jgi:hypothetical protein